MLYVVCYSFFAIFIRPSPPAGGQRGGCTQTYRSGFVTRTAPAEIIAHQLYMSQCSFADVIASHPEIAARVLSQLRSDPHTYLCARAACRGLRSAVRSAPIDMTHVDTLRQINPDAVALFRHLLAERLPRHDSVRGARMRITDSECRFCIEYATRAGGFVCASGFRRVGFDFRRMFLERFRAVGVTGGAFDPARDIKRVDVVWKRAQMARALAHLGAYTGTVEHMAVVAATVGVIPVTTHVETMS
jgi:hypothetical protein